MKWTYEILDQETDEVLKTESGFDTESDAEMQAELEIKADRIRGCYIRTLQMPG